MNDPKIFVPRFEETEIDLKNETGIELVTKVSGKYLVEVCRDGKVIRQPFGPKMRPNLITNNYFDGAMGTGYAWRQITTYMHCGTGTTTPTNADIKLTTPTQFTNTLNTSGGNTYSYDTVNGAATWTFVYDFPVTGSGVTLNEVGGNVTSSTTSGLTTHTLFPSGVVLNTGDNLRLTYSFTFSIPSLVNAITVSMAAVNGFNVSGTMKVLGLFDNIFGKVLAGDTGVNTSGPAGSNTTSLAFANSVSNGSALCSAPTTFPGVNVAPSLTAISGSNVTTSLGTYTNGSLTRTQTITWTPSQPATTASNVNGIQINNTGGTGLYLILASTQTKANTNTLAITLSCTMTRA